MKNNRLALIEDDGGTPYNLKSRNRLIRLYNHARKTGGWRKVAELRGSKNQQYIYNFAMHGIEPPRSNLVERKACYLSARPRKTIIENTPLPEWLRKVKKNIAVMAKETRQAIQKISVKDYEIG